MRGFSLLELLVAFAVAAMVLSAAIPLALTAPRAVESARREIVMREDLEKALRKGTVRAMTDFPNVLDSVNSTEFGTSSVSYLPREDEHSVRVRADASWISGFDVGQNATLRTIVSDLKASFEACDPFVSGDWTQLERAATYRISSDGTASPAVPQSAYMLSDISSMKSSLAIAASSVGSVRAPTLLFFSTDDGLSFDYGGGFDNAGNSHIGFSALAVAENTVFAANAFGSASAVTCADGFSCAQVQVFSYGGQALPERVSALALATSTLPYAATADGASAPASALAFYKGFLYLGLQKTEHGDEFNVIDAHDPEHLAWRAGYRIGRSVRAITVRGPYAYVSTADPSRELMIFTIQDPDTLKLVGVFDAPGSTAFGYGAGVTAFPGRVRFGRTYTSNASELELLSLSPAEVDGSRNSSFEITEEARSDLGTSRDPESARDLLTQDWLTFALLTHRLTLWDTSERLAPYGTSYELPAGSVGIALACRNNLLYLARNDASGAGHIDVLRGAPGAEGSP